MSKRQGPPKSPSKPPRSKRAPRDGSARSQGGPGKSQRSKKFESQGEARTRQGKRGPAGKTFHDPHAAREAQRYENPIASREAILELLTQHGKPVEFETIARGLHIHDE